MIRKMLALRYYSFAGFQFFLRLPAVSDIVHNLGTPSQGSFRFVHGVITALTQNLPPSLRTPPSFPLALRSWFETGRWQHDLAKVSLR
jgi:hypothetical protein